MAWTRTRLEVPAIKAIRQFCLLRLPRTADGRHGLTEQLRRTVSQISTLSAGVRICGVEWQAAHAATWRSLLAPASRRAGRGQFGSCGLLFLRCPTSLSPAPASWPARWPSHRKHRGVSDRLEGEGNGELWGETITLPRCRTRGPKRGTPHHLLKGGEPCRTGGQTLPLSGLCS